MAAISAKECDKDFLYYLLLHNRQQLEQYPQGSTFKAVGSKDINDLKVDIPTDKTEQTVIANILTTVDEAKETTEQLIAKYERIKSGMMYDLLTKGIDENDRIRSEKTHKFKDSKFGRIPIEWEIKLLGRITEMIQDGTHFSPKPSPLGKYRYVTSKNIRFGYLDFSNCEFISPEEHQRIYSSCPVKYGDVLLTKDGANTGNAAIYDLEEEISLLSSVAVIRGLEDSFVQPISFAIPFKLSWTKNDQRCNVWFSNYEGYTGNNRLISNLISTL